MKSYTDLEQSRKLAEILPLESADMWYQYTGISIKDGSKKPIYFPMVIRDCESDEDIPCWSLSALLDVVHIGDFVTLYYDYGAWNLKIDTSGNTSDNRIAYFVIYADNPIDACVEMVLKLHNFDIM